MSYPKYKIKVYSKGGIHFERDVYNLQDAFVNLGLNGPTHSGGIGEIWTLGVPKAGAARGAPKDLLFQRKVGYITDRGPMYEDAFSPAVDQAEAKAWLRSKSNPARKVPGGTVSKTGSFSGRMASGTYKFPLGLGWSLTARDTKVKPFPWEWIVYDSGMNVMLKGRTANLHTIKKVQLTEAKHLPLMHAAGTFKAQKNPVRRSARKNPVTFKSPTHKGLKLAKHCTHVWLAEPVVYSKRNGYLAVTQQCDSCTMTRTRFDGGREYKDPGSSCPTALRDHNGALLSKRLAPAKRNPREEHGIPGQLNVYTKDVDSARTNFGKHNRLLVTVDPKHSVVTIREDLRGLPLSTEKDRMRMVKGAYRMHAPGTSLVYVDSDAGNTQIWHHYKIVKTAKSAGVRANPAKYRRNPAAKLRPVGHRAMCPCCICGPARRK